MATAERALDGASPALKEEMGADVPGPKLWARELEEAKELNKKYWDKCDAICAKYKAAEDEDSKARKYNVLWSVIETMKPLVYYNEPKPHVGRRFNDNDPAARDASMLIERGLMYSLEGRELHDALTDARDDYLLCSRGVIWPKYSPYMQLRQGEREVQHDGESELPEGVEIGPNGAYVETYEYEDKTYEECDWEHVHYRDFLHGAASKWKHVPWVARRVPMDRRKLISRFGEEVGKKVPLTINVSAKAKDKKDSSDEEKGLFAKGEVWEIWSKRDKKVFWLCPEMSDEFLDEQDDILELDGFFPCPKPAFGTKTNDSLMPTPDYHMWQDIAIELDEITFRIKLLTEALRVVGVYDSSAGEQLKRLMTQTRENSMVPVDSWALFAEKGGLKGAVEFLPIEQVANVLERLHRARQALVQELYEITGLSDIVRGASDPRETAAAQKIKGNFAGKRLMPKQGEMIRMADEALSIEAEIISKHYSDDTIVMVSSAMEVMTDPTGENPSPERIEAAIKLIRSNMRQQRIKVDEKSLVLDDVGEDQAQRGQVITGIGQLLSQALPLLERAPGAGPLIGQLMMFGLKGYPLAKSEEYAIKETLDKLISQPAPPAEQAAPSGPSPEELAIQREELSLRREEIALKKREMEMQHEQAMAKIASERGRDAMQDRNRQIEATQRQEKNEADALIRAEQVNVQRESTENAQKIDLSKWIAERNQEDDHKVLDASVEQDKLEAQAEAQRYANAFKEAAA